MIKGEMDKEKMKKVAGGVVEVEEDLSVVHLKQGFQ